MASPPLIVLTGAAGFIGSALLGQLNRDKHSRIVIVDDFSRVEKSANLSDKVFEEKVDRDEFLDWFREKAKLVGFVYHIGARTDTTEFDERIFDKLNLGYSKGIWSICVDHQIPLVYASSAATYGDGSSGYEDDHAGLAALHPLNPYGRSKQEFDRWVLKQPKQPPFWAGLKFFNVYGPNEYHKGRMASVIFHAFHQIRKNASVKLFRSHRPDYADGEQRRDFIYVRDVVEVCSWMFDHRAHSGIYNLGTGEARTFVDLARAVFKAMDLEERIEFIDIPLDIRDIRETYQYYTQAPMAKLRAAGYVKAFRSLEQGVDEYVRRYLSQERYF